MEEEIQSGRSKYSTSDIQVGIYDVFETRAL